MTRVVGMLRKGGGGISVLNDSADDGNDDVLPGAIIQSLTREWWSGIVRQASKRRRHDHKSQKLKARCYERSLVLENLEEGFMYDALVAITLGRLPSLDSSVVNVTNETYE